MVSLIIGHHILNSISLTYVRQLLATISFNTSHRPDIVEISAATKEVLSISMLRTEQHSVSAYEQNMSLRLRRYLL